jgi:septal ring factor EnvC (AmiA/AmiB activator)
MQRITPVLFLLAGSLLVSAAAWADPQSVSSQAINKVNQRVAKNQAEVEHLQKDIGQQESASQQAAERLQQQDRTIAELRQQLKAAQEASKAPAAGH